jgi:hypothetical protein
MYRVGLRSDAFPPIALLLGFLVVVQASSIEGDGKIAREHDYRRNAFEYWGRLSWCLNL